MPQIPMLPKFTSFDKCHCENLHVQFRVLCKRLYSSSSEAVFNYLHRQLDSFLPRRFIDLTTLQSSHAYIITSGHADNLFIASKLISSYAGTGNLTSSAKVFHSVKFRDPFLWNSIIQAYFSNGDYSKALEFYRQMRNSGVYLNHFTVPMVVSACGELGWIEKGLEIHGLVSKLNLFHGNCAVGSSFVYMYSKCGCMGEAFLVFEEITKRDVVAWTALVVGYVQNGECERGLESLCNMHRTGEEDEMPNFRTIEGGLQACGSLGALVEGKCLHGLAVKSGCSVDVQSSALCLYSKSGTFEDAHLAFSEVVTKDLMSWTLVIESYVKVGLLVECMQMFLEMLSTGVCPDGKILSCTLAGFSDCMRISEGKAFHCFILKRHYTSDQMVHNGLLSMYCRFGLWVMIEKLSLTKPGMNDESWSILVGGFGNARLDSKCVETFREMQHLGVQSNFICLVSVISSCSRLGLKILGLSIHCHVVKHLPRDCVSVTNCLMDMYCKAGNLTAARRIFFQTRGDTFAWNALISSYAHSGHIFEALTLFDEMVLAGVGPKTATLVTLLSSCSQAACLEKGVRIHEYIIETGFECTLMLETALIDMYAKCGQLEKAKTIFDMVNEKDVVAYNVMISGYGMHGDVTSAIKILEQMEQSGVSPNDLTLLALLSACTHAGLVDQGKYFFQRMKEYSLKPKLKHYACMVDLLGRAGNLLEAENLILSMPIPPDAGMWGALLTACKIHNNPEFGIRIAKHAIEADPENDGYYVAISDMYSSLGLWEEGRQMRNVMKEREVRKMVGWSAV